MLKTEILFSFLAILTAVHVIYSGNKDKTVVVICSTILTVFFSVMQVVLVYIRITIGG